MVFFSQSNNYFYVADFYNTSHIYAGCHSLMLEYCSNLWYEYDTETGLFFNYIEEITSTLDDIGCLNKESGNNSFDTQTVVIVVSVVAAMLVIVCVCFVVRKCAHSIFSGNSKHAAEWDHHMAPSNSYKTEPAKMKTTATATATAKESVSLAEDKPSNMNNYDPSLHLAVPVNPNWWDNLALYLATDTGASAINGENGSVYTDEARSDYNVAPREGPRVSQYTTGGDAPVAEPPRELIQIARQASFNDNNIDNNNNSDIDVSPRNEIYEEGGNGHKTRNDNIRFLDFDEWQLLASWGKDGKMQGIPMLYNRVEKKHYFPHFDDRTRQVAQRFGVPLPPKGRRPQA